MKYVPDTITSDLECAQGSSRKADTSVSAVKRPSGNCQEGNICTAIRLWAVTNSDAVKCLLIVSVSSLLELDACAIYLCLPKEMKNPFNKM